MSTFGRRGVEVPVQPRHPAPVRAENGVDPAALEFYRERVKDWLAEAKAVSDADKREFEEWKDGHKERVKAAKPKRSKWRLLGLLIGI